MDNVIRLAASGAAAMPRPAQSYSTFCRSADSVDDAEHRSRPYSCAVRCWGSSRSILFTPNVIVFVSDIDRSVRWYRENVGLAEASQSDIVERHDGQVMLMTRDRAGVTLVSSGGTSRFSRDVQMVCFLLEGPPAPSSSSSPLFLVDPDGTSIELPAFPGPVQQ
jgi:hypothetical protein